MDLQAWQLAAGVLTSAAGGGGVSAFFNYLAQRSKEKATHQDAVQEVAKQLIQTALESSQGQIKRLEEEIQKLRSDMAELQGQHAECERNTTELRKEIDRLMAGQVADYSTIRRPRTRKGSE